MTEKEYRSNPAISRSELFRISESPEKFKYYMENPQNPTPALIFGQLFHKMALDPETLFDEFAVIPDVDRRTKEGKEIYNQFLTDSEGKTVVDSEMFEKARDMCATLNQNWFVKTLLSGEREKPFFWTDEMTEEPCKCRVDSILKKGDKIIVSDLKTTDNAETDAFIRSAIKYGYDFQTGMYLEGVRASLGVPLDKLMFVFIVIEKEPPYSINIMSADSILIQRGYDLFREYIGIYHECKQSGNWYGYLGKYNQINNLSLPAWLAKETE